MAEKYTPTPIIVTCPVCGAKKEHTYQTPFSFLCVQKRGFLSRCRKCCVPKTKSEATKIPKPTARDVFDFHGCMVRATTKTILVDGYHMARCREYLTCRYGSRDESAESCLEMAVRYGMDGWCVEKRGEACGG